MASIQTVALVILAWVLVSVGIYIYMDPIKNGVVQEKTFKDFVSYIVILGIVFILILYFQILQKSTGAYIISPFQALNELTETEKAKLKITDVNEMNILDVHPKEGGKKALVIYRVPFGIYKGTIAHLMLNCMSDYRYSATEVPRQTRVEGFTMQTLSYTSANSLLKSSEKSSVEKIIKLAKEVSATGKKGGEKAQELISDVAEQEERRQSGEAE